MRRLLGLVLLVYLPHLVEEGCTRMCDDALIVEAFRPFSHLPAREAAYLFFQIMMGVALVMTYAFSRGGIWREAVMVILGLALLAESHHVIRALASHGYDSGLVTSLPMPLVGAYVIASVVRRHRRLRTVHLAPLSNVE